MASVVLLVEGDVLVRHPLAEYLRECGFKVYEATTGGEAQQLLTDPGVSVDVVLADMTTPGSGFALTHWIRDRGLPIRVILAGSIETSVMKAGGLCNEGPALAKPYEHHLVLERIRQALARREPNS